MPRVAFALSRLILAITLSLHVAQPSAAQEARRHWDRLCQIRQAKFDKVLPVVMHQNGIDMWIVAMREGHYDPMYELLGRGYPDEVGYYIFTDRGGERIERATIGIAGGMLEQCKSYDLANDRETLHDFVAERDPKRIGIDIASEIGTADGLSHSLYLQLVKTLGKPYAGRLISAEKLVSDFRSRHVAQEIAVFAEAGEISRTLAERALSNEVITPDVTTLSDVAWWLSDQQRNRALGSSFDMPSVYVLGPGERHLSDDWIIRPGDLLAIDWGVGYDNAWTDMKRIAYVLKPGENAPPVGVQRAFDKAIAVRDVLYRMIRPGATAGATLELLNHAVASMPGYALTSFNHPSANASVTDVVIGSHSTGDLGHGSGPSIADFNPLRMTYQIRPTNFFSIEFFTYSVVPEWDSRKITMPLEDDAVMTEQGLEWLYPPNDRILLIK